MKKFRFRWYLWVGLPLVVLMGANVVRLLLKDPSNSPLAEDVAKAARLVAPASGMVDERETPPPIGSVSGNGVVEPKDRPIKVGGVVPGRIARIIVGEGQHVNPGDALVVFDSAVEEASLSAATAEYDAAHAQWHRIVRGSRSQDIQAASADADAARERAHLSREMADRATSLAQSGAMSKADLDQATRQAQIDENNAMAADARAQVVILGARKEDVMLAKAQVAAAKARQDLAQAQLDQRTVRAPIQGEVLQVIVREGEVYQPEAGALVVLGDMSQLRVRMDVDERDVGRVHIGDGVIVRANAFPNVDFTGKVIEIGLRMGRKNVRSDDPTERNDSKIREVVIALNEGGDLVIGQRVTCYVQH